MVPNLHETIMFAKLKVFVYEKHIIAQKATRLN